MQRIILLITFFCCKIAAMPYAGYVSFVVIDAFTGNTERVLLVPNEKTFTASKNFYVYVHSISTDKEFPEIIWIDAVINYRANQNDNYQCIQNGHINSNQLYRFSDSRYLIAFDVLDQIDEKAFE